jgi:hypothetical protein
MPKTIRFIPFALRFALQGKEIAGGRYFNRATAVNHRLTQPIFFEMDEQMIFRTR